MSRTKKRGPGRPALGVHARSEVVTVKLTSTERDRWQCQAGDRPLAEWVRERCDDDDAPGICVRITIERDGEDEWYWAGYDRDERKVSGGGIDVIERRAVIKHVEGLGVRVDEDAVVEMI